MLVDVAFHIHMFSLYNFPSFFSFIRFIALGDPLFCDFMVMSGSSDLVTFMSSSCFYSFYMDAVSLSMCLFIPFLADICVNIVSTAIVCKSCINTFYLSSIIMNWVPYLFPKNFISRRSTNFPAFSLIGLVLVFLRSLLSVSPSSAMSSSLYTGAYWSLVSKNSPRLVVPCLNFFRLWNHPWKWCLPGHLLLDLLWCNHFFHYAHLMISHNVPIQCILLLHHILSYHIFPHFCEIMLPRFLVSIIGIPGLHSKIGYPLVISGCFSFVEISSTLCITYLFIDW